MLNRVNRPVESRRIVSAQRESSARELSFIYLFSFICLDLLGCVLNDTNKKTFRKENLRKEGESFEEKRDREYLGNDRLTYSKLT